MCRGEIVVAMVSPIRIDKIMFERENGRGWASDGKTLCVRRRPCGMGLYT